jgi:hypothetical protein
MEEEGLRVEEGRALTRVVLEGDKAWLIESASGLLAAIPSCPMLTAL